MVFRKMGFSTPVDSNHDEGRMRNHGGREGGGDLAQQRLAPKPAEVKHVWAAEAWTQSAMQEGRTRGG